MSKLHDIVLDLQHPVKRKKLKEERGLTEDDVNYMIRDLSSRAAAESKRALESTPEFSEAMGATSPLVKTAFAAGGAIAGGLMAGPPGAVAGLSVGLGAGFAPPGAMERPDGVFDVGVTVRNSMRTLANAAPSIGLGALGAVTGGFGPAAAGLIGADIGLGALQARAAESQDLPEAERSSRAAVTTIQSLPRSLVPYETFNSMYEQARDHGFVAGVLAPLANPLGAALETVSFAGTVHGARSIKRRLMPDPVAPVAPVVPTTPTAPPPSPPVESDVKRFRRKMFAPSTPLASDANAITISNIFTHAESPWPRAKLEKARNDDVLRRLQASEPLLDNDFDAILSGDHTVVELQPQNKISASDALFEGRSFEDELVRKEFISLNLHAFRRLTSGQFDGTQQSFASLVSGIQASFSGVVKGVEKIPSSMAPKLKAKALINKIRADESVVGGKESVAALEAIRKDIGRVDTDINTSLDIFSKAIENTDDFTLKTVTSIVRSAMDGMHAVIRAGGDPSEWLVANGGIRRVAMESFANSHPLRRELIDSIPRGSADPSGGLSGIHPVDQVKTGINDPYNRPLSPNTETLPSKPNVPVQKSGSTFTEPVQVIGKDGKARLFHETREKLDHAPVYANRAKTLAKELGKEAELSGLTINELGEWWRTNEHQITKDVAPPRVLVKELPSADEFHDRTTPVSTRSAGKNVKAGLWKHTFLTDPSHALHEASSNIATYYRTKEWWVDNMKQKVLKPLIDGGLMNDDTMRSLQNWMAGTWDASKDAPLPANVIAHVEKEWGDFTKYGVELNPDIVDLAGVQENFGTTKAARANNYLRHLLSMADSAKRTGDQPRIGGAYDSLLKGRTSPDARIDIRFDEGIDFYLNQSFDAANRRHIDSQFRRLSKDLEMANTPERTALAASLMAYRDRWLYKQANSFFSPTQLVSKMITSGIKNFEQRMSKVKPTEGGLAKEFDVAEIRRIQRGESVVQFGEWSTQSVAVVTSGLMVGGGLTTGMVGFVANLVKAPILKTMHGLREYYVDKARGNTELQEQIQKNGMGMMENVNSSLAFDFKAPTTAVGKGVALAHKGLMSVVWASDGTVKTGLFTEHYLEARKAGLSPDEAGIHSRDMVLDVLDSADPFASPLVYQQLHEKAPASRLLTMLTMSAHKNAQYIIRKSAVDGTMAERLSNAASINGKWLLVLMTARAAGLNLMDDWEALPVQDATGPLPSMVFNLATGGYQTAPAYKALVEPVIQAEGMRKASAIAIQSKFARQLHERDRVPFQWYGFDRSSDSIVRDIYSDIMKEPDGDAFLKTDFMKRFAHSTGTLAMLEQAQGRKEKTKQGKDVLKLRRLGGKSR